MQWRPHAHIQRLTWVGYPHAWRYLGRGTKAPSRPTRPSPWRRPSSCCSPGCPWEPALGKRQPEHADREGKAQGRAKVLTRRRWPTALLLGGRRSISATLARRLASDRRAPAEVFGVLVSASLLTRSLRGPRGECGLNRGRRDTYAVGSRT